MWFKRAIRIFSHCGKNRNKHCLNSLKRPLRKWTFAIFHAKLAVAWLRENSLQKNFLFTVKPFNQPINQWQYDSLRKNRHAQTTYFNYIIYCKSFIFKSHAQLYINLIYVNFAKTTVKVPYKPKELQPTQTLLFTA